MTEDTCSGKRCDLINQILKGTVYESYYCRTHKRHYYPNKPTDTMINPMTPTEQDKKIIRGIEKALEKSFSYQVLVLNKECRDELIQLITADRKRVALEAIGGHVRETYYNYDCPNKLHIFALLGDTETCVYCYVKDNPPTKGATNDQL